MRIHAVILAGGRGERFWPLSRSSRPKQFLRLIGDRSMLQSTFDRLADWIPVERQWIVAGGPLIPEIRTQVPGLREDRIVVEPIARNTAAAIGAAAAVIESIDPGAVLLILPSDHWIPDREAFREDVTRAAECAGAIGGLYLFGIPITYPETGYGYVEEGTAVAERPGIARVAQFHEKPDRELAGAFAGRSDMLWNSGIFVWRAQTILEAIAAQMRQVRESLEGLRAALVGGKGHMPPAAHAALDTYFHEAPSESIDYAVLEKHEETYVSRARFRWSDVGTWLSWGERLVPDAAGNRGSGTALITDSHDCVYYADDGLLALLGVRDLIVVRLNDVTLVCARDCAQDVRRLVREVSHREGLEDFSSTILTLMLLAGGCGGRARIVEPPAKDVTKPPKASAVPRPAKSEVGEGSGVRLPGQDRTYPSEDPRNRPQSNLPTLGEALPVQSPAASAQQSLATETQPPDAPHGGNPQGTSSPESSKSTVAKLRPAESDFGPPPVPRGEIRFRVQVMACVAFNTALRTRDEVTKAVEEPVYMEREQEIWKVRVGDLPNRETADGVRRRLAGLGYDDAFVVEARSR